MSRFAAPQSPAIAQRPSSSWLRSLALFVALASCLLVSGRGADAELKSEWKFGGTLSRAITALPMPLAMLGDEAIGRSPSATQPSYQGGSLVGLFNRPGPVGGFAAGFLGSGMLGLLFGHGAVSEVTSAAAVLGLGFQLLLIVLLMRLIWTWWRDDQAGALADLSPRQLADAYGRLRHESLPDIDRADASGANGNALTSTQHSRS